MAKPEWGSKRVCQNCGAKFYDFHRSPILCPSCGTAYQPDELLKPRRSRVEPKGRAAAKPVPAEEAEEEVEEEADALLDDAEEEEEEDEVEEALDDEDEEEADEDVKAVKPVRDPLIPDDEVEEDEALDEELEEEDVDDVEEEFEDDEPER